jgi:bacteriorhodopsin
LVAGVLLASSSSLGAIRHDMFSADAVHFVVVALMTLVLLAMLVRRRAPSAGLALATVYAPPVYEFFAPLTLAQPSSTWGIVLVAAGFALLPLGVVAHRRWSRLVADDDERLAHAAPTDATSG